MAQTFFFKLATPRTGEDTEQSPVSHTAGGIETGVATLETVWRFLQRLRIEPPFHPPIHFWVFLQRI